MSTFEEEMREIQMISLQIMARALRLSPEEVLALPVVTAHHWECLSLHAEKIRELHLASILIHRKYFGEEGVAHCIATQQPGLALCGCPPHVGELFKIDPADIPADDSPLLKRAAN